MIQFAEMSGMVLTLVISTVWTVACLSNGDIAAGSSDGLVRVFTRDDDRVADVEALAVSQPPFRCSKEVED